MSFNDAIYIKKCLGKDKKEINIYKIRTMIIGAETKLDEIAVNGLDSFGKHKNDPRITLIGAILRKYWIDELPQICNLIKGDLKLVGIRPKNEKDWQYYPTEIMDRTLQQKPGLMAIQYAFPHTPQFKDKLKIYEDYLDLWETDPIKTDKEYFCKIWQNIVFGGIRSC